MYGGSIEWELLREGALAEQPRQRGFQNWVQIVINAPLLALALTWDALTAWRTAVIVVLGSLLLLVFNIAYYNGDAAIAINSALKQFQRLVLADYASAGVLVGALSYSLLRLRQLGHDLSWLRPTWPAGVLDGLWGRYWGMVLGVGGTGKTTFLQGLEHEQSISDAKVVPQEFAHVFDALRRLAPNFGGDPRPYEVTEFPRPMKVAHRKFVYDIPGQNSEHGAWDERISDLSDAARSLIVFVSTFGYSAEIRKKPASYFDGFSDPATAIEAFRADALEHEFGALEKVITTIEARWPSESPRKLTFIHIINMAGFWWPQRETVKKHYSSPRYVDLEQRLREKVGNRLQFQAFIPASFLFGDLTHESIMQGGRPMTLYRADFDNKDEILRLNAPMRGIVMRELYRTQWPRWSSK